MSINNPDESEFEVSAGRYEEFEDILELDNVAMRSTDALLPTYSSDSVITEESLKRDIERVEKLRVEEVRWFYKSGKKNKWKPFIGCDSICIELEWRCISISDNDIKRVCVRGGMYEVDVLERRCYPVYWSSFSLKGVEESVEILRGTWFYDGSFVPLNEDLADRIEVEHIERWKGFSLDQVKKLIGNSVMHSVKLQHCHVDWYSVNDVYLHSDAVSYRALRNIVQKFGASKTSTSGSKLHRGYVEDAMHEDCLPGVEHLVFVVHGIGAKPDRHKIVRNTNLFRMTCDRVAAKHFTHYTGRVEFLPVEWRSKLRLVDGVVDTVTPKKGQGMRQFLNNNLMDIMYYTSPLYRGEIVDGLKKEIFRLYSMFKERNPDFSGKISVFAHSLGSVIMHDIMAGWSPESLFEEYLKKQYGENETADESTTDTSMKNERDLRQLKIAKVKVAQLEARTQLRNESEKGLGFFVQNFFCVGSPLAIFLSLRGQRPGDGQGTQDDIIPRNVCGRIFNIFHPSDPVAYRYEPLVSSLYAGIAPLQIHWHNAIHKTPYHEMLPKPYQSDTVREMSSLSTREPSIDGMSADTSDVETFKEDDIEIDAEVSHEIENKEPEKEPPHSPALAKRSSYLKSLSGGAFRVGKAIWSRARGSSVTSDDAATDGVASTAVLINEQEMCQMPEEFVHRIESGNSSGSCSPVITSTRQAHEVEDDIEENSEVTSSKETDTVSTDSSNLLDYRLDYELQEGFTESRLGYASITSHTSYWGNQDVAFFVLMQIHPAATMVQSMQSP